MTATARKAAPRRRFARITVSGIIYFRTNSVLGEAMLADVSLSGICMVSPRRFTPGERIVVAALPAAAQLDMDVEMKGVVAWCIPARTEGEFRVGIRIYRSDEASEHVLHELVQSGLRSKRMVALSPLSFLAVRTERRVAPKTLDKSVTWFTHGSKETRVKHAAAAGM